MPQNNRGLPSSYTHCYLTTKQKRWSIKNIHVIIVVIKEGRVKLSGKRHNQPKMHHSLVLTLEALTVMKMKFLFTLSLLVQTFK